MSFIFFYVHYQGLQGTPYLLEWIQLLDKGNRYLLNLLSKIAQIQIQNLFWPYCRLV